LTSRGGHDVPGVRASCAARLVARRRMARGHAAARHAREGHARAPECGDRSSVVARHSLLCRHRKQESRRAIGHDVAAEERTMERCTGCQYYDRNGGHGEGKAANAGQCRRGAPQLSPINQKTYMIEGVWPTVRDDDWCGEWKAAARRPDTARIDPARVNDLLGAPLSSPLPMGSVPRINAQTARAALGVLGVDTPALFPGIAANGRGND
jgi:hypothetical protein